MKAVGPDHNRICPLLQLIFFSATQLEEDVNVGVFFIEEEPQRSELCCGTSVLFDRLQLRAFRISPALTLGQKTSSIKIKKVLNSFFEPVKTTFKASFVTDVSFD